MRLGISGHISVEKVNIAMRRVDSHVANAALSGG